MDNVIETERISNLTQCEELIRSARADVLSLKSAFSEDRKELSKYLIEKLDLKLHELESYEFVLERRKVKM